jgi:hypothetical protein
MSDRPPVNQPTLAAQVGAIILNLIALGFVAKVKEQK